MIPAEIQSLIGADGILCLRVIPGAKVQRVAIENNALKLWIRTAPENGKANAAVISILSEILDVPIARLNIVRGATARDKRVRILAQ